MAKVIAGGPGRESGAVLGRLTNNELKIFRLTASSPDYPVALREYLKDRTPASIAALGDMNLLKRRAVALFCSVKCPGDLILKTYDLARELRDAGVSVIGGFHSPMERECLDILLRGKQPVIACPARRLTANRLPSKYAVPIREGRLLMLSPFGETVKRATATTAGLRNELVAALADRVFVAHAATGSKTEALCRKVLAWGKPLLTFDSFENHAIIDLGAKSASLSDLVAQSDPGQPDRIITENCRALKFKTHGFEKESR